MNNLKKQKTLNKMRRMVDSKNLRSFFQKIIGAALLAGIAGMILITLAKLILGVAILGGIAMLVSRKFSRGRRQMLPDYAYPMTGLPQQQRFSNDFGFDQNQVSKKFQSATIVPID